MLAESEMSNKVETTTKSLRQAQQAEAERNSESGKSKQKLEELKRAEAQLADESKRLQSALALERSQWEITLLNLKS